MSDTETSLVVCIRPDGSIEGLHDESIRLPGAIRKRVERASHVEWSPGEGGEGYWYVESARTGECLFRDVSRARCLAWEREHFNRRLRQGLRPFAGDED